MRSHFFVISDQDKSHKNLLMEGSLRFCEKEFLSSFLWHLTPGFGLIMSPWKYYFLCELWEWKLFDFLFMEESALAEKSDAAIGTEIALLKLMGCIHFGM